jgi:hypothetical protein
MHTPTHAHATHTRAKRHAPAHTQQQVDLSDDYLAIMMFADQGWEEQVGAWCSLCVVKGGGGAH